MKEIIIIYPCIVPIGLNFFGNHVLVKMAISIIVNIFCNISSMSPACLSQNNISVSLKTSRTASGKGRWVSSSFNMASNDNDNFDNDINETMTMTTMTMTTLTMTTMTTMTMTTMTMTTMTMTTLTMTAMTT